MEADEGHLVVLYSYCFVVSREPEVHKEIKKEGTEFGGSDMIKTASEILRECPRFISNWNFSHIRVFHSYPQDTIENKYSAVIIDGLLGYLISLELLAIYFSIFRFII